MAHPIKPFGIVTTGVSFKGLNMDVGHVRHIRWHKGNDQQAWVNYNRQRGQHASGMEHATPEQFWVDKTKCRYTDENGLIQNTGMDACAEAVSTVKAIQIAASQGQKVYTITPQNAATALPKLSLGGSAGDEIRQAIQAGKEVTFHEKSINAFGWTGMGYSIIDPDTGGGSYLIEGKGNGATIASYILRGLLAAISLALLFGAAPIAPFALVLLSILGAVIDSYKALCEAMATLDKGSKCLNFVNAGLLVSLAFTWIPFFMKSILSPLQTLWIRVLSSMVGGKLFEGISNSKMCTQ